MRYTRTEEKHVERRQVPSREVCDSCGRDVDHADRIYHEETVTIEACIGDVYPEGSHQISYDVDVCGECFVQKVVPALKAIGIKMRERNVYESERVPEPQS